MADRNNLTKHTKSNHSHSMKTPHKHKKDDTSEFRNYMLNRINRRKHQLKILKLTTVLLAVVLAFVIAALYLFDR